MLKVNIRVLVSLFCIVFSCILTLIYLFGSDDDKLESQIIASTQMKPFMVNNDLKINSIDINNVVAKENNTNTEDKTTKEETTTEEIKKEEEVIPEPAKVYEGMTLDELASKLDRSLKNQLAGKGYLYASYSLENGVDPYLAVAISLEETGCNWNCSDLVVTCNNVGGMKGSGCGSYGYFNSLDDGIKSFIDNISNNYVSYGLTTAEAMNSKYAENPAWAGNVNNYINKIKNN